MDIIEEFQYRAVDGIRLFNLNKAELMSLGVDVNDADNMLSKINELMAYSTKYQSKHIDAIIKKMEKFSKQETVSRETKENIARFLSVKELLLKTFLNKNIETTENLFNKLWGLDPTELDEEDRQTFNIYYCELHDKHKGIFKRGSLGQKKIIFEDDDILKIHLVVIEEPRAITLRKCLSPITDADSMETSRMQTALLVGPFLLHWSMYSILTLLYFL
jgi:hypothetical protein